LSEHINQNQFESLDDCPMDKIRRVNDLEKAMEQVRHRIRTNEKELSDAWSQINRNGWILVGLVIVCSALIGALF
jgi:hypothetical protein